ncbi:MAG: helix-turn-helix domain-containing protein [Symploca sp. SIO2D2]|nr:helix-turn-helix domain-containing protein [Symploca sp. SIO2D2]NER48590.1 helix-turn-helix domain-containing protein [Symploca sp. SIO1A3]
MTNPRPLTQREQYLIQLYSNCQLGMTPRRFYAKWRVNQDAIASICSRSISTVQGWFTRGRSYRHPQPADLRHLALMDFLLEHFEEIPEELINLLCSPNQKL